MYLARAELGQFVIDVDTNRQFTMGPFPQWGTQRYSISAGPSKGDMIGFFVSDNPKYRAVPDDPDLKKLYCLSKSMCESANKVGTLLACNPATT